MQNCALAQDQKKGIAIAGQAFNFFGTTASSLHFLYVVLYNAAQPLQQYSLDGTFLRYSVGMDSYWQVD